MAGAMRKMAVYLGLVEDDLDGDYETDQVDVRGSGREPYAVPTSEARTRPAPELAVRPTPTAVADRPVATLKPVIINLTGMDDNDAKRIVDFAAGLVFGLRGTIERVTNKVFLLSPANVDVGAEARAQIAQDGFFNQS
jgi:cell division inhibitor SepF